MGLLSFLFGRPQAAPAAPAGAAAPQVKPVQAAPAPHPSLIQCRTEMVDRDLHLCGYRFAAVSPGSGVPVDEAAICAALAADGLADFARQRLALVPLSAAAVLAGLHRSLAAPQTLVLLDCRQAAEPVQLAAAVATLRADACQLALCGLGPTPDAALLDQCDVVVLDLGAHALPELQALARRLQLEYPQIRLLAEGVASWDEQRMCASWGCSCFIGHFLSTQDGVAAESGIDHSRATSIELLNLLRGEAELAELIEVAKRDPGISYRVLQWTNAPANGQITKVTSLQQAFMVLGRQQLYRGLMASMFRMGGASAPRDEGLLELALTRARFLELVGEDTLAQSRRDELFLIGLLSLLDVLLGVTMAAILARMQLSDDIAAVLLKGEGPYEPYLRLVLLLEHEQVDAALPLAQRLGIAPERLGETGIRAFQWAQQSLRNPAG